MTTSTLSADSSSGHQIENREKKGEEIIIIPNLVTKSVVLYKNKTKQNTIQTQSKHKQQDSTAETETAAAFLDPNSEWDAENNQISRDRTKRPSFFAKRE
jgi:arginine/lysine/ornithine decarboxylase